MNRHQHDCPITTWPTTAYPVGKCYCSCGADLADPRGYFKAPGHDSKALYHVITTVYGNVATFLLAHGYGPNPTGHTS